MKQLLISLALILSSTAAMSDPVQTRIYGGKDAQANEWPWMAALLDSDVIDDGSLCTANGNPRDFCAQFCGGSLIAPGWIMTAAHCISPESTPALQADDIRVLVDDISLDDNGTRREIAYLTSHPGWIPSVTGNDNDIALLQLASPVDVPTASVADSQRQNSLTGSGSDYLDTLGWGQLAASEIDNCAGNCFPITLQQVALDYLDNAACRNAGSVYQSELTNNMICAHEPDAGATEPDDLDGTVDDTPADPGGEDSCGGDSGGPLFIDEDSGDWVVGITSWGLQGNCGNPATPGVYARTVNYAGWIENVSNGRSDPLVDTAPLVEGDLYAGSAGTITVQTGVDNRSANNSSQGNRVLLSGDSLTFTDADNGDSLSCSQGASDFECLHNATVSAGNSVSGPVSVSRSSGGGNAMLTLTASSVTDEDDYRSGNNQQSRALIFSDAPHLTLSLTDQGGSGLTTSVQARTRNLATHLDSSGDVALRLQLENGLMLDNADSLGCVEDAGALVCPLATIPAGQDIVTTLSLRSDIQGFYDIDAEITDNSLGIFPDGDTTASTSVQLQPAAVSSGGGGASSSSGGLMLVPVAGALLYWRRKKRSSQASRWSASTGLPR
jgi:secreted trypsin-like serine protease